MNRADSKKIANLEELLIRKEISLQELYSQIGKSIMEIAISERENVDKLVDEIIEIRRQTAAARRDIECPLCTAQNQADSRFCRKCGAPLEGEEE